MSRNCIQARAVAARRQARYELQHTLWQQRQARWETSGGLDPQVQYAVDLAWWQIYQHYRLGIGEGGFQAETGAYADIASRYPLVYATVYRNFFGRHPSGRPDITHLIPRRMMQMVFLPGGKTAVEKINSAVGLDPRWIAAAWPIVPEEYRPAVLWAWNHITGAGAAHGVANVLLGDGLDMAQAFLHYPLDLKPRKPAEVMPLVWQAPTFGYYCLRSGWQEGQEFVGQVFLKASLVKGWNHGNAGSFRIWGLGHGWVTTPESRNGVRAQEPVVYLPEDEHNRRACGRLAWLQTFPDGSGSLTIDLSDVYARTQTCETPEGTHSLQLHDSNLIRQPENLADSGITGLRAVAFDYSGLAGVPCVTVLVDKVQGGGPKVWRWQLPEDALDKVVLDGRGFLIDYGDASMKATFVTPVEPRLHVGAQDIQVGDPRHGFHGTIQRVAAADGGEFFVVITFQTGRPPEVEVQGKGLDTRVKIGRRVIRFDGERILLEK